LIVYLFIENNNKNIIIKIKKKIDNKFSNSNLIVSFQRIKNEGGQKKRTKVKNREKIKEKVITKK